MKTTSTVSELGSTFYVTGGTLRQDAACYLERLADSDLLQGLQAGDFCYVLTSRQMGKSSLMIRTAGKLRQQGASVVVLDLTAVGQNVTPEQWYDGLILHMGRQLGIEEEVESFWQSHPRVGPAQRFFLAIHELVLGRRSEPLVIFVDETDIVRSLPFSTDEFFAAIRECYNRRAQEADFERLTFCLLGVATPSDLIRDTRMTPFNIGRRIDLSDFTAAEAAPLSQRLAQNQQIAQRLLDRVLFWSSGHPYLTQRLCRAIAEHAQASSPRDVDQICTELFLTARAKERDDNLLFVRERILNSEVDRAGLLELYGKTRRGKSVPHDEANPLVSVLVLSGVVGNDGGVLRVRNEIYRRVFNREWIVANLPEAERRRQRLAYRRGTVGATSAMVIIAALLSLPLFRAPAEPDLAAALGLTNITPLVLTELTNKPAASRTQAVLAAWPAIEAALPLTPQSNVVGSLHLTPISTNTATVTPLVAQVTNLAGVGSSSAEAENAWDLPVATFLSIEGVVQVLRAGALAWDLAYPNQMLFPGDKVRTGKLSGAAIELQNRTNRTVIRIGELSLLSFPSQPEKASGFEIIKGRFFHFFDRKRTNDFHFKTPPATGTIRG